MPEDISAPAPRLLHHAQFPSSFLPDDRDIVVYLPPGYAEGDESMPVLYLHDGQNLFDKHYAHPGADSNWQNVLEQDGRSVRLAVSARF